MSINPRIPRWLLPPDVNKDGPSVQTHGGMMCVVVERHEIPRALIAARGGDYIPALAMTAIHSWMGVAFTPQMPKPKCATCEHDLHSADDAAAFFVSLPMYGNGDSIIIGVCARCVRKIGSDGLMARSIEHFKKIWPKATVTR